MSQLKIKLPTQAQKQHQHQQQHQRQQHQLQVKKLQQLKHMIQNPLTMFIVMMKTPKTIKTISILRYTGDIHKLHKNRFE